MSDLISRAAAINAICEDGTRLERSGHYSMTMVERKQRDVDILENLPSAQPEHLRDDDFETIRIHLNAHKEKLCNLHRWEEAEEYQRIINRFMSFASAQPERKTGRWKQIGPAGIYECSVCGQNIMTQDIDVYSYCHGCGAKMEVSES